VQHVHQQQLLARPRYVHGRPDARA
jgi:hypothetical protein